MGQKVNPTSLRVGINKYWQSTWFEKKDYSTFLKEDYKIRNYIEKNYSIAGISSVIIERAAANLKIIIHTSKPGVLIGKKGADIEKLRNRLSKLSDKSISLDIKEIKKPETDASLLADSIARQLEKRIAFRKSMCALRCFGRVLIFSVQSRMFVFWYSFLRLCMSANMEQPAL